ncbi:NUDIX hydrolase [Clostridium sp. DL-VIII]|uniref:NUDIX hydrolase n=1 Tax=Clostridium sp. DL-VIII TaxID=641107 RepID=UPI00023B007C|nr:NUDIX domain-containing protein [Clostridium sp. DL-VIII]EHJ00419.1 NUDIX hydrolase [Clostridium sp. DL-VIII]
MKVNFYKSVEDSLLKFAVIVAKHNDKWVFCKHKERNTYEVPGGHREDNERIIDTAKRELFEETGAYEYEMRPVCVYSVIGKTRVNSTGEESYGMLYYADIKTFKKLPISEIENICMFDGLPTEWTYPLIQPKLIEKVQDYIFNSYT